MADCIRCCRSAFFYTGRALAAVGTNTAVASFNNWLGGQILNAANWAPMTISEVTLTGAIGGMGCGVFIATALRYLALQYDNNVSTTQTTTFMLTACSSLISYSGSVLSHLSNSQMSYAVAAGGIGGALSGVGVLTILGAIHFGDRLLFCCQTEDRRMVYVLSDTNQTPQNIITEEQIQNSVQSNGALTPRQITESLRKANLHSQALAFDSIHNRLQPDIYYPQQQQMI